MTDQRPISRRAMLRAGFLRDLLGSAADRAAALFDPVPHDHVTRTDVPPGHHPTSLVMRYPKTTADVDAGAPASSPASRHRRPIPVLRPPGAVDEATFLAACTRCDACMVACPHDAIVHAPARLREAVGTPMIDPDRQPCRMCDDFPCIEACEPDVLSHLVPKAMGTARITPQTCLAHHGTTCTVCVEQCPVDGAIEVVDGKPRVVESSCTGCGVCRHVCPSPENAVLLMPVFSRPSRPPASHHHA
ncbi:MAG: 4Fe-4S binding protein [Phycisphaerales bacterium]|nr:4Fe-4S binding protein [Phycisphaerales bacterium]